MIAIGDRKYLMLKADPKVLLFLQVTLVVGLPLLLWGPMRLGRYFPLPIIQIFAGIALGPSIFGALYPEGFDFFFNPSVLSGVDTLANVALVLFVFIAGCELDRQVLRGAAGTVLKIGITGVAVPWIAGAAAAAALITGGGVPGLMGAAGNPTIFAVAFGLSMAVTALPVLVVLLRELGFNQKPIGTIALAIGGVDDALLWGSLTFLLPFAAGRSDPLGAFAIAIAGGILTILLLVYVVSPLLQRLIDSQAPERFLISLSIIVLFSAAALNEATQLHAAIGAFLTGLLLPDKLRELCEDRFDTPVTLLLLPFLFLATGLKTSFSFTDGAVWTLVLIAMIVCVLGKFLGVTIPAYLSRESLPFSMTLGVLLQCKGLMEIVVVTILYQRGIFGPVTFSALVLVALISTAITVPLCRLCQRMFGEAATEARELQLPSMAETPQVPATPPSPAAVGLPAPAQLVFDDGLGIFDIGPQETVIGRHSADGISIKDVRISRHHARIRVVGGRYEIHNQTAVRSEPNPIAINGVEKETAFLSDGDRVSLGGVVFTFKPAR